MGRRQRLVSVWVVMGLGLAAVWPGQGGVLCIGADGHVAFELPHAGGSCDDPTGAVGGNPNGEPFAGIEPADCLHIEFGVDWLAVPLPRRDHEILLEWTQTPVGFGRPLPGAAPLPPPCFGGQPPGCLLSPECTRVLSSVVLLI